MVLRKRWVSSLVLILSAWSLHGQVRDWRDLSGNRVRGEMTSREAGTITLRLEDGSSLVIPMDNLSADDRRIAFAWRPRHGSPKLTFGRPWKVSSPDLTMAWIPPGDYRRGSSVLEKDRSEDETLKEVVVSRGFWLSKHEITQAQWTLVMGNSPSEFDGDDLPVEGVSWAEASTFCEKSTENARANGTLPPGYVYSLPSEAQWEYACRARTVTAFFHGNEAGGLEKYAWTSENAEGKTHPVGELRPNRWGLHDMHGNVLEWCRDFYSEYPKLKSINPTGPKDGSEYLARGGSILNSRLECRSAKRFKMDVEQRKMVGLRLALAPNWR